MACGISFELTTCRRHCSYQSVVFLAFAPYVLATINTNVYQRGAEERGDELDDEPAPPALTLFCMLTGSFMFAMIVLFCTLRLRCMERRRLPPKTEVTKKVITEEEADRRCPVTPCRTPSREQPTTCVVCLAHIEDGELCRELQCGHTFHADCIMSWWMYKPRKSIRCPLCRQKQRKPTAKPHVSVSKDLESSLDQRQEDGWDAEDPEQLDLTSSEREQHPTVIATALAISHRASGDDQTVAPGCLGLAELEEEDV